jgi:short-subunit dehydrogenase
MGITLTVKNQTEEWRWDMELSNKTIVITGASKGLGRETALRLCRRNPNLVLVARTASLLEETQQEIENLTGKAPLIIPCDISDEMEVNRMSGIVRDRFHHIDVLVNNAGIGVHKIAESMSGEEMRRQFEVNFYGPFYCIKALLPLLMRGASPYILNIGSLAGEISFADNSIYAATKSALSRFSEGLRRELKKSHISVGLFLPGLVDTSFQDDRKDGVKAPPFMLLDRKKVAAKLERMINRRQEKAYMYRWMLLPMKLRQLME